MSTINLKSIPPGAANSADVSDNFSEVKSKHKQIDEENVRYTQANTGVKVVRCGPNYRGANGGRMAIAYKEWTAPGATANWTATLVFSSDCIDGNPAFSAAPIPYGAPAIVHDTSATAEIPQRVIIKSITATQAVVYVEWSGNITQNKVYKLYLGLFGGV